MAEFSGTIKQACRLCATYEYCEECPIGNEIDYVCPIGDIVANDAEKIDNIVLQWAVENPEPKYPTWKEWQDANFPDASHDVCPAAFTTPPLGDCCKECYECVRQSIPGHIAAKLGVKPIEGRK